MVWREKDFGSIKLNGETVFYHNLAQNKDKLNIYKNAILAGKISFFDQVTITRLRKLYYGLLSGLIYIYYEPTDFSNIGNKVELLSFAMTDRKYKIVHGETDSTREILFFKYGVKHLDFNSWLEVEEGHKVWVYDLFSMLKIEKDVYYQLENPKIKNTYPKSIIINHPGYDETAFLCYKNGFDFMLVPIMDDINKNLSTHPFREILSPEVTRFKKKINFDDLVLSYESEYIKKS